MKKLIALALLGALLLMVLPTAALADSYTSYSVQPCETFTLAGARMWTVCLVANYVVDTTTSTFYQPTNSQYTNSHLSYSNPSFPEYDVEVPGNLGISASTSKIVFTLSIEVGVLIVDCEIVNGIPACFPEYLPFTTVSCTVTATPSGYSAGCT